MHDIQQMSQFPYWELIWNVIYVMFCLRDANSYLLRYATAIATIASDIRIPMPMIDIMTSTEKKNI